MRKFQIWLYELLWIANLCNNDNGNSILEKILCPSLASLAFRLNALERLSYFPFAFNSINLFVYQVCADCRPLCMVSLKRTHFPVVPIQVFDCFLFDSKRFDCTKRTETDLKDIPIIFYLQIECNNESTIAKSGEQESRHRRLIKVHNQMPREWKNINFRSRNWSLIIWKHWIKYLWNKEIN